MIEIEFVGLVIPKGRPRFGKNSVYTPEQTKVFEEYVSIITKSKIKKPIAGGVAVDIMIKKKPPKSWSKKKKKAAIEGKILAAVRPDVDNYAKSIIDGMDGIAFKDDGAIVDLKVQKKYAEKDGAIVRIKQVDGETPYKEGAK